MKTLIYVLVLTLGTFGAMTGYTEENHAGHDMAAPTEPQAALPLVNGEVKKIDKTAGKVLLAHDAIPNLDMPAMTMAFEVKDAGWLEDLKAGDRIRFMVEDVDGAFTVVHYEPAE